MGAGHHWKLDDNVVERRAEPFPYLLADHVLDEAMASALLSWFETEASWRLVETDFYEQYEFSLLHVELPEGLRPLTSAASLGAVRRAMEQEFGASLTDEMALVAHKLVPGQRIAIHNDHLPDGETHRLTVQLNRGLDDDDGGFFMLFNSFDAADVHRILRPVNRSGVAFAIGPDSHHAVSRLHGRERYTLVFSFHARRPHDPNSTIS